MNELHSNVGVVQGIKPQVVTSGGGAVNTGDVDLRGFGTAEILVDFGTSHASDTLSGTNKYTVAVTHAHESTDTPGSAGDYENVAAADILGATPSSGVCVTVDLDGEDEQVYNLGYIGGRRYLKVTVTPNGTLANGCPIAVTVVKGRPDLAPVA